MWGRTKGQGEKRDVKEIKKQQRQEGKWEEANQGGKKRSERNKKNCRRKKIETRGKKRTL